MAAGLNDSLAPRLWLPQKLEILEAGESGQDAAGAKAQAVAATKA